MATMTTNPPAAAHPSITTKEGPMLSRRPSAVSQITASPAVNLTDIEHLPVSDDPRKWSNAKKNLTLFVISFAAMCGSLSANVFFPGIAQIQSDLNMSDGYVTAVVSVFIFFQGTIPILWSALSEIRGRKIVYVAAFAIFFACTVAIAFSRTREVFFAMRVFQAVGSSAVLAIGAGSLADIYDSHERGSKLGIYYISPVLGPSIGALLGGALTSASNWRAAFYFLIAYAGICLAFFIFLPDTYRNARSRAWQTAARRNREHAERKASRNSSMDMQMQDLTPTLTPTSTLPLQEERLKLKEEREPKIKLQLRDVNPLSAVGAVMRLPMNAIAILFSGLLFAVQYSLSFTAARSFAASPYNYSPLRVGLVLVALGGGSIIGSVGGGKYSDYYSQKKKAENDGVWKPEYRLMSTVWAMPALPISLIAYAWCVQYSLNIGYIVTALAIAGLSSIWVYSATLAFLVDRNPGRSSSAVACNSAARGISGCIASLIAEPLTRSLQTLAGQYF